MYNISNIREIHLELTNKCQARCPMCPRRINGGPLNPFFNLSDITLSQFKQWFPDTILKQLTKVFMCGNLGDPIIAQDCVPVFQYLREVNPNIELSMHTNGSARNPLFWRTLAETGVRVIFGIDGSSSTHALHRIGTDYDQIIRNATDFIKAGGNAEWHMLAFAHNEHEIESSRAISEELGFKKFQVKHTARFIEDHFQVLDEKGGTTHVLYPTAKSLAMIPKKEQSIINIQPNTIQCKAKSGGQLYVAADGTITPCCWLDMAWAPAHWPKRYDYIDKIGTFPNLNQQTLQEIFDSGYFDKIERTWGNSPLIECSKQCGKFDKLGAQFEN